MDSSSLRTGSRRGGPRLHPRHRRRRRRVGEAPGPRRDPFSAGAERLSAHRPRQVDLPELRRRGGVRRHLQPAVRRHEPGEGRRRVRRRRSRTTSAGSASTGTSGCSTRRTTSSSSTQCAVQLIENGQGVRRQPDRRRDARVSRHADASRDANSPYRDRSVAENLDLFARMRAGEFPDGAHVLRAKIDMASPNINMRDPVLYRIRRAPSPSHRRRVVHLSDVRLRAPAVRCARAHHALALHARVRGSPAAVRLADRQPARCRRSRSRSSSRA